MDSPRCELTELLKTDCAHCRGIKSPEEEETLQETEYDRWLDQLGNHGKG